MPLFKPQAIARSKVATHNPIKYDNGRAEQGFYTPSNKYFAWEVIPHDNKWSDGTPSFMAPASHYHLLQEESFHISSGSGYWYLDGRKILLKAGDDITIPRFVAHRFESIPNADKIPLTIQYRYDDQYWEMEERFFRNILTYMYDCRQAKIEPDVFQLCVMLADCWMPVEFVRVPGIGEYGRCVVNTLMMWAFALVGWVCFGYRANYTEYCDPVVSRRRIEKEDKKGS